MLVSAKSMLTSDCASDRLRSHANDAQDDADDFLDRPSDGDLDVFDAEAGRLGDDDDARKGDFGINAAGHAEHRHEAGGGEQDGG